MIFGNKSQFALLSICSIANEISIVPFIVLPILQCTYYPFPLFLILHKTTCNHLILFSISAGLREVIIYSSPDDKKKNR